MTLCKKSLMLLLFLVFFTSCAREQIPINEKAYANEDQDIMFAFENMHDKNYAGAKKLYLKLFNNSHRGEYLYKALQICLYLKENKEIISLVNKNYDPTLKNFEKIYNINLLALISVKKYDEALKKALLFIKTHDDIRTYEIIANIYYIKGQYQEASKYFESIYLKELKPKYLISLVDILYARLHEKQRAISYLETHLRLHGYNLDLGMKLFSFYRENNNLDGVISVLKRTYNSLSSNKKQKLLQKKVGELLVSYLEIKDINDAIKFLKAKHLDDEKLLSLYEKNLQFKKAYRLSEKIYKKTKDINMYAKLAILEFQSARHKRSVLKSVIKKMRYILSVSNMPIYQNFLGYLLIKYNLGIEEGLELTKKALKVEPNNLAYMDSIAWGEYKLRQCKRAKILMKKVVGQVGLLDKDIKYHWDTIQKCKNKKLRKNKRKKKHSNKYHKKHHKKYHKNIKEQKHIKHLKVNEKSKVKK